MKAIIKYSKNIAGVKMHIVGKVKESFSPWTQYSYGTVREGAKLPAWLGDGGHKGQLSNQSISNLLSLMWKGKMPAYLPTAQTYRQLFRQFKEELRNRNLHGGHCFSPAPFMLCDKRFSEGLPQANNGTSHSPQVIHMPFLFSSHHLFWV